MRPGTVIRCKTDDSMGIVISHSQGYYYALFRNYRVIPIREENAIKTGKFFDLDIIWDMVYGR